jgi:hypothetical protein
MLVLVTEDVAASLGFVASIGVFSITTRQLFSSSSTRIGKEYYKSQTTSAIPTNLRTKYLLEKTLSRQGLS